MIFPLGLVRNGAANVRRNFSSQLVVDTIENLRVRFIYDWVIAVIKLKRDGVD